jgi:UDP-glucose 4-epimerase
VLGSNNLLTNLDSAGVEKAVFLSTDKAVYPVNAMGMSKALMEKLVRSENYNLSSIPLITRYGNVIGSRGSVIPAFIESIKKTGSVEITDENMTRFMMSLDQSVALVLYALKYGASGDLFVQKAPSASVKVLVDALEIIFQQKIERKFVGVRPGEKIHESLLTAEEYSNSIESDQYFQVPRIVSPGNRKAKQFIDYSSNTTRQLEAEELSDLLLTIPKITQLISNS